MPTSAGSLKKQESPRQTSISALLTMPKPLIVWITTNWKILQEIGIPDYLTCLLSNLYAGQEPTVRAGYGTDWFQIRKGVDQGCILSLCFSQFSSAIQSCPTVCDPMDCSTPGFPVHHQHPELAQTHVHRVGDAIQPSHPLSPPSPPAFNLSQHQGFSNKSVLHIR